METMPQAMPNMVRNVRSLCAQRVRSTSPMRSLRIIAVYGRGCPPNVSRRLPISIYESQPDFVQVSVRRTLCPPLLKLILVQYCVEYCSGVIEAGMSVEYL